METTKNSVASASPFERLVMPFADFICYVIFKLTPIACYSPSGKFASVVLPRATAHAYKGEFANGEIMYCVECGRKIANNYQIGFLQNDFVVCFRCHAETKKQWEDWKKTEDYRFQQKHGKRFPQDFC